MSRKTRIIDVVYNASNNELVRTKTLVKSAIVSIDATPFRQWYEAHYAKPLGRKKNVKLVWYIFLQILQGYLGYSIPAHFIDANHYDFSVIVKNFGPKLRCYGKQSTCYGFSIIAGPEPFSIIVII